MKNIPVFLACFLFLLSCNRKYTSNGDILNAERILNTHPDSSFNILSGIHQPEKMSSADYAAWCLNYTHARYKLQKPIESDSLIKVSIKYYSKWNDKLHCGIAWYLSGCINRLNNRNKEAIIAFKKADELLETTNEYRIKGLVEFNLGYIYIPDELYNQSLKYFQKSLINMKYAGDQKTAAYAYSEISDMYNKLDYPIDSVLVYSNKALELAKNAGDSLNYYSILTNQGVLLYNQNYNLSKNNLLRGFRYLHSNIPYYSAFLAYIYSNLNRQDSARYYLALSKGDSKCDSKSILSLVSGSLICKNDGNYQNAYTLLVKAYTKRDSVYQKSIKSQLYRIDKQYDLAEKQKENYDLTISNQTRLIWIILLSFAILLAGFIIIQISNWNKKQQLIQDKKLQAAEFEKEWEKTKNEQKREIIRLNVSNKIDNTLKLKYLKKGILQEGNKDSFLEEITYQSTLTENFWKDYLIEVNKVYDNGITRLKESSGGLSHLDQLVIALICMNVNVNDSCSLLNMEKNTMYVRRKTIKKRLGLDANTDLENWIIDYLG
jgi:hypothetical protein